MSGSIDVDPIAALRSDVSPGFRPAWIANEILRKNHYLGPINRGIAWMDDDGVIVLTNPTSRRLPRTWMELARWCIVSRRKNAGSSQWARCHRALRKVMPHVTTIVSYSDPSVGHTGALYKSSNWLYAPTWHRMRPPPTGNGKWTDGKLQSVKDRWVFPLGHDAEREAILQIDDQSIVRNRPELVYREPRGVDWKAAWRTT